MSFINTILNSETSAKQSIEDAQRRSVEIIERAKSEQDQDIVDLKRKLSEERSQSTTDQKAVLTMKYKEILHSGEKEVDHIRVKAESKHKQAVNFVIENL